MMPSTTMAVPSIAVSVSYIGLTLTLAQLFRRAIKTIFVNVTVQVFLQELIAAAELCGCCFELVIIADNYGLFAYAVFLFLLTIWWGAHWEDAAACPYIHMESWVQGNMGLKEVILRIWAEVTGGILVFRYVRYLWALEFAETHMGRAYAECGSDLQVSVFWGAIIEAVATCLCRITSKTLGELEPKYAAVFDSFFATSLVVAAFNYSGGYFNPVLATSLKLGCVNHPALDHIIVYWLGASTGAIASVYLYTLPEIHDTLVGQKVKIQ